MMMDYDNKWWVMISMIDDGDRDDGLWWWNMIVVVEEDGDDGLWWMMMEDEDDR